MLAAMDIARRTYRSWNFGRAVAAGRCALSDGRRRRVGEGRLALGSAGVVGCLLLAGCGGPPASDFPPDEPPATEEAPDQSWDTGRDRDVAPEKVAEANPIKTPRAPEFKPGMSVNEAIAAVPSDYDFVGIDAEVLAKPLQDLATYKACNVTSYHHFQVRIAVWDGRVVGADVQSPNKQVERCVDGVVRGLEYKEKVQSINTVEYSF